jgi:hypothetical protein
MYVKKINSSHGKVPLTSKNLEACMHNYSIVQRILNFNYTLAPNTVHSKSDVQVIEYEKSLC